MELSNDQIDVLIFLAYVGGPILLGAVFVAILYAGKAVHSQLAASASRRRAALQQPQYRLPTVPQCRRYGAFRAPSLRPHRPNPVRIR